MVAHYGSSPKFFIAKVPQVDERTKAGTMQGKDGEKDTLDFSIPRRGPVQRSSRRRAAEERKLASPCELEPSWRAPAM